jgi:hypothetical protein
MAAKPPSDEDHAIPTGTDGAVGLRPITDPLTNTQPATEIGRSLQTRYPACLNDALPDKLAALVRELQEREDGSAPSRQR